MAQSQLAIGSSSNLAQIALSYSYNFKDAKYQDYVSILSVLAQLSIDSSKRLYNVDINSEIKRIKQDMDIQINGYPAFWKEIKRRNDKRNKSNRNLSDSNFNYDLVCPMNELAKIKVGNASRSKPIPMREFFIKHPVEKNRRKCKKVEDLIEKYSLKIYDFEKQHEDDNYAEYLILMENFEELVEDIRKIGLSSNYIGLMSWLIDRAFEITPAVKQPNKSRLNKNRSLLLKVLYTANPKVFMQCFKTKDDNNTD